MRQLDNLHRAVQVQENVVARMVGRIARVNNGVRLVCPGEAIRPVQLMHCPPVAKHLNTDIEHEHNNHADTHSDHIFRNRGGTLSDELLTVEQVAAELQLHPDTVRRYIREKKLRSIRLSNTAHRIRRSELERFLKERESNGEEKKDK
jgi:excisionase family DNA binding protein